MCQNNDAEQLEEVRHVVIWLHFGHVFSHGYICDFLIKLLMFT
jgi:hypothetical protein